MKEESVVKSVDYFVKNRQKVLMYTIDKTYFLFFTAKIVGKFCSGCWLLNEK